MINQVHYSFYKLHRALAALLLATLVLLPVRISAAEPNQDSMDRLFTKFVAALTRNGADPVGTKLFGSLHVGMSPTQVHAFIPQLEVKHDASKGEDSGSTKDNSLFLTFNTKGQVGLGDMHVVISPLAPGNTATTFNRKRYDDYLQRLTRAFGEGQAGFMGGMDRAWHFYLRNGHVFSGAYPGADNMDDIRNTASVVIDLRNGGTPDHPYAQIDVSFQVIPSIAAQSRN